MPGLVLMAAGARDDGEESCQPQSPPSHGETETLGLRGDDPPPHARFGVLYPLTLISGPPTPPHGSFLEGTPHRHQLRKLPVLSLMAV